MKRSNKHFGMLIISLMCICLGLFWCKADAEAAGKYTIQVNKGTNVVTIYDSNDKPYKAFVCSVGWATPTGTFPLKERYRWHELDGPCWGQYCTRITEGFLFHSVFYNTLNDPSDLSVRSYNKLGTTASHGCVRLTVADAKWIYDNCAVGTTVKIIYGTSKNDPLGKPTAQKLDPYTKYKWDPTDPAADNPYKKYSPTLKISSKKKLKVSYGEKVNYLAGVTAKNYNGNNYSKKVKYNGQVDTKTLGTYDIEYYVTSSKGITIYQTVTYEVVDTDAPVISGVKNKTVSYGAKVDLDKGVKATTVFGQSLKSSLKITVKDPDGKTVKLLSGNKILLEKIGDYKVTYSVTGTNKKTKTVTKKITSEDRRVVITANDTIVEYGAKFNPLKIVSLTTYTGKSLKPSVYLKVSGNVDTSVPGEYIITYTANNKVNKLRRTMKQVKIIVLNQKNPVIKTSGADVIDIPVNYNGSSQYDCMQGVTAKTTTGVNLTSNVQVTVQKNNETPTQGNSILDISSPCTYVVTYTVTVPVEGGKTTTKTVTINVK